jgi:hypothetical protein
MNPKAPNHALHRALRRPPNDYNFGPFLMLAVTAGAFLLVTWVATKGLVFARAAAGLPRAA